MARNCSCGCDVFRFKVPSTNEEYYNNVCRNCNHTLAEHSDNEVKKQAE